MNRFAAPRMTADSSARRALMLALLVVIAVGTAACGSSGSTGGGGGLGLPDGNGAGVDTATTGGDTAGTSGGDGATAGDSAGGGDAEATVCVALGKGECDSASECGSEQYCDPCSRTCETPRGLCEPCNADVQCEKADVGSTCIPYATGGTFCGRACLGDAGCAKGYACKDVGAKEMQCVPKSGSCGPVAGGCKVDADCPYTTICNADYASCTKGCSDDTECPQGKVCALFRCVAPCTGDDVCKALAAEAVCQDARCKIPGGCLGVPDCPEKATYCDNATHKCKNGCLADADCKEFGMKCQANGCVAKGCLENWECSFGEVCDPSTGKCSKAEGPFCGKCDAQDDKATACGGDPNKCFSFQDKDGNKVGDFCGLACSTAASGPCPQGYGCQELKDDQGASQGKYCLRECWKEPFKDPATQP